MDFVAVVDQAIALLCQRGRLTYRTLQLQFQLDDTLLAALKDELIEGQRLAVDEAGRVLVWTGEPPAAIPDTQRAADGEMRFHALLPTVIGLLQGERRITYRTLTYVFSLDETLLEAIREELTFRRVARDEDGKGLVWTGEAPSLACPLGAMPHQQAHTDATTVRSDAVSPLPPSHAPTPAVDGSAAGGGHAVRREAPAAARSAPEAERRQLTVMFCDLVDSTHLSRQLDPEDYRAVVRAYQATAATVIQRFDGYMAQYLGDGLLVYFGYPHAHEDEAQRAVQASLELVETMAPLNTRLEPQYGVRVAVRIGLHTGLVVIGAMGGGNRQEQLAMGDTPNIAARLQGLAAPNTVVLSAVTARLVREAFVLEECGVHHVKGVAEPLAVYGVLGRQASTGDEEEAGPGRVPVLVGRDEEVGLLLRRWEQSKEGLGQVVLLSGEAGIGKSALVQTLREHVGHEGYARLTFRCSPSHTNSALYPVIAHLQRLLQGERDETPETRLATLERLLDASRQPLTEVVPLLAALLAVALPEGRYAPLTLPPQQQRQQTLDALVAWLLAEAERQPVLAVYEDLHWADPSTLEMLGALLEQVPTVPMLTVLTFRPVFVPPWPSRAHLAPITLNRLERPQVEALMTHLAGGKALPTEVMAHIVAKTDGVPLFVEELTKMLLESDLLQEDTQHYMLTGPLTAVTIPATLQDSLMARLDRLGAARDVAQLGAVVGREFTYDVLQVLAPLDDATLQAHLARLVEAELLYQRGRPPQARYIFKHALIQDAAYASLLKSTRQQVHQQIAQVFETQFSALVETQPELVAQHYTVAGCTEQAARLLAAGGTTSQRALGPCGSRQSLDHRDRRCSRRCQRRLQHTQQALSLWIALGAALLMTKGQGAPEVAHAYTQAHTLCQQVGETPELVPVLFGLWRFYAIQPQWHTAREIGDTLLHLSQRADDPALAVIAHYTLGLMWCWRGAWPAARSHLEAGIARYTPDLRRAQVLRIGRRSGGWLPTLCRADALVFGVSGASAGPRTRGPSVGAGAGASLDAGVGACHGDHGLSHAPRCLSRVRACRGRRRALDRARHSPLEGHGHEYAGVGARHAGAGRGESIPDTPGGRRLAGHWCRTDHFMVLHLAGGGLRPSGPHGRGPPSAGRGPHPGGAAGGTLVGGGNPSPAGCLAPAAAGDPAGGGGSLVAAGPGRRPPPAGQVAGAAGRHEPGSPLAAAGQARRGLRAAGTDLWLVHRGL